MPPKGSKVVKKVKPVVEINVEPVVKAASTVEKPTQKRKQASDDVKPLKKKKDSPLIQPSTDAVDFGTVEVVLDDWSATTNIKAIQPPQSSVISVTNEQKQSNFHEKASNEKELLHDVVLNLDRNIEIPSGVIAPSKQQVNPNEFYLYHDLERQAKSDKFEKMSKLLNNIKLLDVEGGRTLFVVIRMFALKNKHSQMFEIPYQAKVLKEINQMCDIEFDAAKLPDKLLHMLYTFTEKHLVTMKEEESNRIVYSF